MSQHVIPDSSKMAVTWQKSSASGGDGNCVEFAAYENGIAIRPSKAPHGLALLRTRSEIAAMIERIKAGEFDHLAKG